MGGHLLAISVNRLITRKIKMSQQDKIKLAQRRVADQWDAQTQKKEALYNRDNEGGVKVFRFVVLIGGFVLVASVLFGGDPDLIDAFRQYLSCK